MSPPNYWGFRFWKSLHGLALLWDALPAGKNKKCLDMILGLSAFGNRLPCGDCSTHFLSLLKTTCSTPEQQMLVKSNLWPRLGLWEWTYWVRSVVHAKNHKTPRPKSECVPHVRTELNDGWLENLFWVLNMNALHLNLNLEPKVANETLYLFQWIGYLLSTHSAFGVVLSEWKHLLGNQWKTKDDVFASLARLRLRFSHEPQEVRSETVDVLRQRLLRELTTWIAAHPAPVAAAAAATSNATPVATISATSSAAKSVLLLPHSFDQVPETAVAAQAEPSMPRVSELMRHVEEHRQREQKQKRVPSIAAIAANDTGQAQNEAMQTAIKDRLEAIRDVEVINEKHSAPEKKNDQKPLVIRDVWDEWTSTQDEFTNELSEMDAWFLDIVNSTPTPAAPANKSTVTPSIDNKGPGPVKPQVGTGDVPTSRECEALVQNAPLSVEAKRVVASAAASSATAAAEASSATLTDGKQMKEADTADAGAATVTLPNTQPDSNPRTCIPTSIWIGVGVVLVAIFGIVLLAVCILGRQSILKSIQESTRHGGGVGSHDLFVSSYLLMAD